MKTQIAPYAHIKLYLNFRSVYNAIEYNLPLSNTSHPMASTDTKLLVLVFNNIMGSNSPAFCIWCRVSEATYLGPNP